MAPAFGAVHTALGAFALLKPAKLDTVVAL